MFSNNDCLARWANMKSLPNIKKKKSLPFEEMSIENRKNIKIIIWVKYLLLGIKGKLE